MGDEFVGGLPATVVMCRREVGTVDVLPGGLPHRRQTTVERLDLHNVSVDKTAAAAQLCGMLHLQSGRVCVLPVHHQGNCNFVSRDEMRGQLTRRPTGHR